MFTFLLLAAPALAACDAWYTVSDLNASASAAQSAYVAMELDSFKAAYSRAQAQMACLAEVVTPPDAASLHRIVALDGWVSDDRARSLDAFRAARSLQPAFALPSTIAPAGNPLYALYQMALDPPGAAPTVALKVPAGHAAYVDGSPGVRRPATRPAVLQLVGPTGETLWSAWLPTNAPDPDWSAFGAVATVAPRTEALPAPVVERRRSVPLWLGAGGAALASGALYGVALTMRGRFDDPSTPLSEVEDLRDGTNTLVYTSAGVGVVAVGLGAFAIVSARW